MEKAQYIGCSGYYYPAWRKKFYPEGIPPKEWLRYYSSVFNAVELNSTFYRTPTAASLRKYYDATPPDFRFSVKMSKQITHIQKLTDTKLLIAEFQKIMRDNLKEKVIHFLFQLPPSFLYSEGNLALLLANIPHSNENVVEFRHISWWNEEVQQQLAKAGITFCNVDHPKLETFFMHTTPQFYMRLHGNPILFKSAYELDRLTQFYKEIPENSETRSIFFNNTFSESGYTNALRLKRSLEGSLEQLANQKNV